MIIQPIVFIYYYLQIFFNYLTKNVLKAGGKLTHFHGPIKIFYYVSPYV